MSRSRKRTRSETSLLNDASNNNTTTDDRASASSKNSDKNAMLPPPFADPTTTSTSSSSSRRGNSITATASTSTSSTTDNSQDRGFTLGSRLSMPSSLLLDQTSATAAATTTNPSFGLYSRNSNTTSSNPTGSSRSTLFGRVMQQSAQKSTTTAAATASDGHHPANTGNSFHTPTKAKRLPSSSSSGNLPAPSMMLLSPGGFNLQNAVQAAVASSPFAFASSSAHHHHHSRGGDGDDGHSNGSFLLDTPKPKPAWRQTTTTNNSNGVRASDLLPRDWSLKEKLILQSSSSSSSSSTLLSDAPTTCRWMQRIVVTQDGDNGTKKNQGTTVDYVEQWHAARTHWQYPATPIKVTPTAASSTAGLERSESNVFATTTTMMEASNKFAYSSKMESRAEKTLPSPSEQAWQQLQYPPSTKTLVVEKEWQGALTSLYHTWRIAEASTSAYFYCRGPDHTLLFFYNDANGHQPQAMISCCNRQFRTWFESQHGITPLKVGFATTEDWSEATSVSRWKDMGKTATVASSLSPASPALAAELAALRRAHVFGRTVGADVSVSIRGQGAGANQIAAQRRALQQVPPLVAVGTDACDALMEYYRNMRGQMVGPLSHLPLLLAPRSMGPFCHASLQTATVRLFPGRVEVLGTLLPDSIRDLVGSVVSVAATEQEETDDDDEEETNVRIESKTIVLRAASSSVVRPLDDAVVGQANLFVMEDGEDSGVGELVSQVVWDSDQPDTLSYKVDTAALTMA